MLCVLVNKCVLLVGARVHDVYSSRLQYFDEHSENNVSPSKCTVCQSVCFVRTTVATVSACIRVITMFVMVN